MTKSTLSRILEDFDDGHSPGSTKTRTQLAVYKNKNQEAFLSVFDNLLSAKWRSKAYEYASTQSKPWGTYVTMIDALDTSLSVDVIWDSGDCQRAISLVAVRALFLERGLPLIGDDIKAIHGTAVWCLSSGVSNSVNYHIDYAELYRYETNVIHPPLYAGTCHLSPLNCCAGDDEGTTSFGCMEGGDFQANTGGVNHYQKFGYKGRLVTTEQIAEDALSADWITVRYRCNRGILHDGNFPHQSTPVTSIPTGVQRVILGFNCFTEELSECNLRAPEHSDAFNRTIRLYQTMAAIGAPVSAVVVEKSAALGLQTTKGRADGSGGLCAADLMRNPALARLLVTAARKIKAKEVAMATSSASGIL